MMTPTSPAIIVSLLIGSLVVAILISISFFTQTKSPFLKRLAAGLLKRVSPSAVDVVHFPVAKTVVITEQGSDGQSYSGRLFVQLRIIDGAPLSSFSRFKTVLIDRLVEAAIPSAIYDDINCASSLGLLTWFVDPDNFRRVNIVLDGMRDFTFEERVGSTLLGRTYANRHEKDIIDTLFRKSIRNILHPTRVYAVWYPLKRKGDFYLLSPSQQCTHLLEHAALGRQFASLDLAFDIRLNCFGLDHNDNEFVIGVVADTLYGPSKVIEEMRKTKHTSVFMESLGPFFVGRKVFAQGCYTCKPCEMDHLTSAEMVTWREDNSKQ